MSAEQATRWIVTVSQETDLAVRSLLAEGGSSRGDLSSFVEDAVRWRLFDRTLAQTRACFADLEPEALQALIDEAVESVRDEMRDELARGGETAG